MPTALLGMASHQKTQVISPFPNGWDCGSPFKAEGPQGALLREWIVWPEEIVGVDRIVLGTF